MFTYHDFIGRIEAIELASMLPFVRLSVLLGTVFLEKYNIYIRFQIVYSEKRVHAER